MDNEELDAIFSGDDAAPVQQAEVIEQAPEPEAAPTVERDEQGRFKPKGENEGAPPAPEDRASKGQEAAIVAERRKRQEAEARIADMERRLAELSAPKQPEAPPPSIWEDDRAALEHHQRQTLEQARVLSRLETSEMLARQSHADFGEVFQPLNQFLNENPALMQRALTEPHPWDYAYKAYKNNQTLVELGAIDINSLKSQLMEQVKAEMAAQPPATPTLPRSLAGEQSARSSGVAPAPFDINSLF